MRFPSGHIQMEGSLNHRMRGRGRNPDERARITNSKTRGATAGLDSTRRSSFGSVGLGAESWSSSGGGIQELPLLASISPDQFVILQTSESKFADAALVVHSLMVPPVAVACR
ncbi:hypothetical protein R1flu_010487 [Riccia fluitans]|uniref:Uncharacterized protein n=1 Tax=Riccia fluitans TaxID=41844 RepID=A0ABD1Z550_9MARC